VVDTGATAVPRQSAVVPSACRNPTGTHTHTEREREREREQVGEEVGGGVMSRLDLIDDWIEKGARCPLQRHQACRALRRNGPSPAPPLCQGDRPICGTLAERGPSVGGDPSPPAGIQGRGGERRSSLQHSVPLLRPFPRLYWSQPQFLSVRSVRDPNLDRAFHEPAISQRRWAGWFARATASLRSRGPERAHVVTQPPVGKVRDMTECPRHDIDSCCARCQGNRIYDRRFTRAPAVTAEQLVAGSQPPLLRGRMKLIEPNMQWNVTTIGRSAPSPPANKRLIPSPLVGALLEGLARTSRAGATWALSGFALDFRWSKPPRSRAQNLAVTSEGPPISRFWPQISESNCLLGNAMAGAGAECGPSAPPGGTQLSAFRKNRSVRAAGPTTQRDLLGSLWAPRLHAAWREGFKRASEIVFIRGPSRHPRSAQANAFSFGDSGRTGSCS
jgi:hypothetical protein